MACREDRPLRFKVGDVVEANVGQYMRGKIIRIWDQANAYRIELEDRNRNVWAPVDLDDYVRLPR
jgi:hypothetical protein